MEVSKASKFSLKQLGQCLSGGDSGREPPVPIPNTEVKPASADGTWGFTPGRVGHRRTFFYERGQLCWPLSVNLRKQVTPQLHSTPKEKLPMADGKPRQNRGSGSRDGRSSGSKPGGAKPSGSKSSAGKSGGTGRSSSPGSSGGSRSSGSKSSGGKSGGTGRSSSPGSSGGSRSSGAKSSGGKSTGANRDSSPRSSGDGRSSSGKASYSDTSALRRITQRFVLVGGRSKMVSRRPSGPITCVAVIVTCSVISPITPVLMKSPYGEGVKKL